MSMVSFGEVMPPRLSSAWTLRIPGLKGKADGLVTLSPGESVFTLGGRPLETLEAWLMGVFGAELSANSKLEFTLVAGVIT